MEITATTEQKFMIMLHERINTLEDELLRLEKQIQNSTSSHYHKIDVKIPFQHGNNMTSKIKEVLNLIFNHRKKFEPIFAAWNWHISHEQLLITLILTTKYSITEEQMKKYIENLSITYTAFYDLYIFIQYFNNYYHDEDEGDTKYNYEYWHSHYGNLYNLTDYEFTDEPFTKSKNYNDSKELQYYLRKWIFHPQKNWIDILRIFL
uniref:Uncharacterized protein n=1 Tax=viral metagenome TaxID=1070528 RepID=A0A6C0CQS8_9ZZZZ